VLAPGSPWRPAFVDALQLIASLAAIQILLSLLSREITWDQFAVLALMMVVARIAIRRPWRGPKNASDS
jgi:hypothetical protein